MSYLFRSRMSTETDIQKLNSAVDESFDKGTLIRIRVSAVRIFFIGVVLVAVYFAYYWSQVAAQAALANLLELSVSLDALATAIAALGLVMFGMVLGRDWKDSEREQAERLHYKKLEDKADPITLRALIRMRIALPKGITLEQARSANPSLFSKEEFVRRLLEP